MSCFIMACNCILSPVSTFVFLFNDPTPTEIYTLSLHDALPICHAFAGDATDPTTAPLAFETAVQRFGRFDGLYHVAGRSEEHTSELQSQSNLVCRLLLEKKKKRKLYLLILSLLAVP